MKLGENNHLMRYTVIECVPIFSAQTLWYNQQLKYTNQDIWPRNFSSSNMTKTPLKTYQSAPGFTLKCNHANTNWKGGSKFHKTQIIASRCLPMISTKSSLHTFGTMDKVISNFVQKLFSYLPYHTLTDPTLRCPVPLLKTTPPPQGYTWYPGGNLRTQI